MGVKNAPLPTTHFRLIVEVDSGTKLLVGRVKSGLTEYLLIRADLQPQGEDLRVLEALDEDSRTRLILEVRLELARRNIGYSGLQFPPEDFNIFKRLPINESLTEHEFLKAIDEMEAAVHATMIVFLMGTIHLTEKKKLNANGSASKPLKLP